MQQCKPETIILIIVDDKIPYIKGALEPFAEVVGDVLERAIGAHVAVESVAAGDGSDTAPSSHRGSSYF